MGDLHHSWDNGLPAEVLALVASLGGIVDLKAMRAVSKTWQTGFELAVKGIIVPNISPVLPEGEELVARFPELANLNIGASHVNLEQSWLQNLAAPRKLRCLTLGSSEFSISSFASQVTSASLANLQGLPLTSLDLSHCQRLTSLEALQGMPLTHLSLRSCKTLAHASLEALQAMPLASLSLDFCGQLGPPALDWLRGLPLTSLSILRCQQLTCDAALEHLRGLPLTKLALSGTGILEGEMGID